MGAFFTNVQVRAGDTALERFVDAIVDAADGFELVDDETNADRVVRVLPPDDRGWVAIYDQATESQDGGALDALGTLVSEVAGAPAIGVTVHDSDVLLLTLFNDGEVADRYNSFPDYFGPPEPGSAETAPGHPERWASALDLDARALQTIWGDEALFAEDTLRRTIALVGCDAERAGLGFRYAEALPEGTRSVCLRRRVRPAWETPVEGPPRLELQTHPGGVLQLTADDGLRTAVSCRNVGGVGRGLGLSAWGTALDQGLIDIERFELLLGTPSASNRHRMLTPADGKSAEGRLLHVDVEDAVLPAGSASPVGFGPGVDMQAIMQAMHGSTVHVNLVGRVRREGTGTLGVGFVPHDNRQDGQVGMQFQVEVGPALPKPLRFADFGGVVASSAHLLRPLAGRSRLVALVVFEEQRGDAVERVSAWLDEAAPNSARVAVYRRDPQKRPKSREGALNAKLALKDMRNELTVQISHAQWGLTFGTGALANHEEQRAPTLIVSSRDLSQEEAWVARIDAAARAGAVVQAAVFRSDEEATLPCMTAYENACQLGQTANTLRSWAARWVRVPGNVALWLGPELAARLSDDSRASLRGLADVDEVGACLRLALRDEASMSAFEQALAALLPSAQDGQAATMALYGRT